MKHKKLTMKKTMLILLIGLSLCYSDLRAQEVLPEVKVTAMKYKYLSAVDNRELPQPVRMLERMAAEYDVKNSEYYDDQYDEYFISFYLPHGYVLATYDKDGKITRAAERFKDVALPSTVARAVANAYPNWAVSGDVYLVTYKEEGGASKVWKVVLKDGDRRRRVKVKEDGEIVR
jgi:hypothetical protein